MIQKEIVKNKLQLLMGYLYELKEFTKINYVEHFSSY